MKSPLVLVLLAAVVAALTGCSAPASNSTASAPAASAPTAAAKPSASASPAAAAARPADATLKITSPKAGDSLSAGPIKVSVDYSGPTLVPAADSKKLDDYHLHYILDEDAAQFIGTTVPVPAGNPKIIHSAAKEVTFDNVAAGSHTVAVVMSGNNHVSVSPPASDSVTFTVK